MSSLLWARWMIYRGFMEAVLQFVEPKRRDNRGSLFLFFFHRADEIFDPEFVHARAHAPGDACVPGTESHRGLCLGGTTTYIFMWWLFFCFYLVRIVPTVIMHKKLCSMNGTKFNWLTKRETRFAGKITHKISTPEMMGRARSRVTILGLRCNPPLWGEGERWWVSIYRYRGCARSLNADKTLLGEHRVICKAALNAKIRCNFLGKVKKI